MDKDKLKEIAQLKADLRLLNKIVEEKVADIETRIVKLEEAIEQEPKESTKKTETPVEKKVHIPQECHCF